MRTTVLRILAPRRPGGSPPHGRGRGIISAVTEVGGNCSHASSVAREFGIPLVNGALDATQVITDGALVVVDGSAGVVEL